MVPATEFKMPNTIAELRQRQHDLKAEATALLDKADKEAEGVLTAEQDTRFKAIQAEVASADEEIHQMELSENGEAKFAEGRKAGTDHAIKIVSLCAVAGLKVSRVLSFLNDGKSEEDVRAAIIEEQASSANAEIVARNHNTKPDQPVSWAKSVEKVNARVKA